MRSPERRRTLRAVLLAACVAPGLARAAQQAAGPVQVGPSWGRPDVANHRAALETVLSNLGPVPDRLIRISCPASGHTSLQNAVLHADTQTPTPSQVQLAHQDRQNGAPPQNGLDLPAALHGQTHPVTARIALTDATQPLTDGTLVPCTLSFAHAGEQIVMFTLGEVPRPTDEP